MEFKHIMFIAVLLCSGWALLVSGVTSINDLGTTVTTNSELKQSNSGDGSGSKTGEKSQSNFGEVPIGDEFTEIIKVLNLGLPVGLIAIVLLIITYKHNPIGICGLAIAIGMYYVSANQTIKAKDIVQEKTEFSIDARVWWM